MRYWVFHEQQLEAALAAYVARRSGPADAAGYASERESMEAEARAIAEFLDSREAWENKLQGGRSYVPMLDEAASIPLRGEADFAEPE